MATRKEVRLLAAVADVHVYSYSPGDGVTRYRFFEQDTDYFAGDGMYTALGAAEALTWLRGYLAGKTAGLKQANDALEEIAPREELRRLGAALDERSSELAQFSADAFAAAGAES